MKMGHMSDYCLTVILFAFRPTGRLLLADDLWAILDVDPMTPSPLDNHLAQQLEPSLGEKALEDQIIAGPPAPGLWEGEMTVWYARREMGDGEAESYVTSVDVAWSPAAPGRWAGVDTGGEAR